jgi:hypothetical protein
MNPPPNTPRTAVVSPFNTPHEKNTVMPLIGVLWLSQQGLRFNTPSTPRIMHTGDKRPSDLLMDTPEYATQQVYLLCGTVDKQEELLIAILQKSSMVEEIVHALDA